MPEIRIPAHWQRLQDTLAEAGIDVEVSAGLRGTSHHITIRHGAHLIEVHDKHWRKNPDIWCGWQVHIEGVADSIVKRHWRTTKRRSEVVAAVKEALQWK